MNRIIIIELQRAENWISQVISEALIADLLEYIQVSAESFSESLQSPIPISFNLKVS